MLLRIYRLTRGHRKGRCNVSKKKLIAKTQVKKTRLLQALVTLEERGYIKRLPDDTGNPNLDERGMNLEMLLSGVEPTRAANPSAERTRPRSEPNKYKDQKKDQKGAVSDINKCPDCRGAIWLYLDGHDKPPTKCKHENLLGAGSDA